MTTATERYQEARKARDEAEAACKESAKLAFAEQSASIFEAHPVLTKFRWTQCTPYFNDGDACTFSAHTDYPSIYFANIEDDDVEEFSTWQIRKKQEKGEPLTDHESAGMAVVELLRQFSDDDYEQMFGDHVEVEVTRNGVEVEEYSHD